jgi:hypothetical protein
MRPRCFRTISAKKPSGFKAETLAYKQDAVAPIQDAPKSLPANRNDVL